jgi:PilZ domain
MHLVPSTGTDHAEIAPQSGRRAARVGADRRAVSLDLVAHGFAIHGLVAIDVSATGCQLSGSGQPPPLGSAVRLDIRTTTYGSSEPIDADVVRVERSAFGRHIVGLRFAPLDDEAYARVLAWRDACRERSAEVAFARPPIG